MGDQHVLGFGEAQFAGAVAPRHGRQLDHGGGLQPAHRHVQPHPVQARLTLLLHAQAGAGRAVHQVGAIVRQHQLSDPPRILQSQQLGEAVEHGLAVALQPQGFHQVHHSASVACLPVAVVLEVAQHRQGERRQLLPPQPQPQGDRQLVALGREKAAHHHGEPQLPPAQGRQKSQVVVEQEAVGRTAHGHVELARQVAGAVRRQQPVLDRGHQRARVDDLLRIDTRQRVAGDVARVVVTRLTAGEPHRGHLRQQARHVLQQQAPQLEVLPGGDVGAALVAAAIHGLRQHVELLRRDHPVGEAQAHHEPARRHGPEEDPQPLQADGEGGFIEGLPASPGQLLQARFQIQAAALGLGLFDLAQPRLGDRGRRRGRG